MRADLVELAEGFHGLNPEELGALSPLPIEVLLGASAQQRFGAIFAQCVLRFIKPRTQVMNAIAVGFELLGVYRLHFVAVGREVQLSPRLGLSCDALVEFRVGHDTRSGPAKLRFAHRA